MSKNFKENDLVLRRRGTVLLLYKVKGVEKHSFGTRFALCLIAQTATIKRERFLLKETEEVSAKDFTPKKVLKDPEFYFSKYFPEYENNKVYDEYEKLLCVVKKGVELKSKKDIPVEKTFEVGDIVVGSWGWEQTNIDFYRVTGRTERSVTLQEIGKDKSYCYNGLSGTCVPVEDCVGEDFGNKKFRIRLEEKDDKLREVAIVFDRHRLRKYDGQELYFSEYY